MESDLHQDPIMAEWTDNYNFCCFFSASQYETKQLTQLDVHLAPYSA